MEDKKYELTDEEIEVNGHFLHRIIALKDFGNVKAGELGGFIEKEKNLSQEGNCWVSDKACVYEDARVFGDAWVFGETKIRENAQVYGDACVRREAEVRGSAKVFEESLIDDNAKIYDEAEVYGSAWVYGNAEVCGNAKLGKYSIVNDEKIDGKEKGIEQE